MGTCSSVHKSKMPIVPSPRKDPELKMAKATTEFGSKREMFFDSRTWLDSDCEDDFFSVNGDTDFIPSQDSTPNNQCSTSMLPTPSTKCFSFNKFPDSITTYPTGRKKLAELFQETLQQNSSNERLETERKSILFHLAETDHKPNRANSEQQLVESK